MQKTEPYKQTKDINLDAAEPVTPCMRQMGELEQEYRGKPKDHVALV